MKRATSATETVHIQIISSVFDIKNDISDVEMNRSKSVWAKLLWSIGHGLVKVFGYEI